MLRLSINRFLWVIITMLFCFVLLSPLSYAENDKIVVLIDPGLYNSVSAKFDRYVNDVEVNFPVDLLIDNNTYWESAYPEDIRNFLINEYNANGIKGALLVGQIPYALWEQSWPEGTDNRGISSVYYEDMDGSFSDTDYDGFYDWHTFGPNEGPEIWVCWMRPPELNQADYLNTFFDKTHDYYTGLTTISERAFAAFHEDYDNNWDEGDLAVKPWLEGIYGVSNVDTDGVGSDLTYDTDIENRLNSMDYEIVDTWQHAFSWGHSWDSAETLSDEAMAFAKGPLMIFIHGCHSGDFHDATGGSGSNTNIVVAYAFGSSMCQAGSGTSWSYGTEYKYMFYDSLDNGNYLGNAWFEMESYVETKTFVQNRYGDRTPEQECAGNNLIGNPFLVLGFTPDTGDDDLFYDNFEDSGQWNSEWDSYGSWQRVTARPYDGSYSAEIDGNVTDSALVSRTIDVSGETTITVTFKWYIESGLDTGEYLAFEVSPDGGSNWIEKASLRGNVDQENMWHDGNISIDVSSTNTLTIRFLGKMSSSNEDAYVDVVNITSGGGGGGDTTPPHPDPMTWSIDPHATGSTSLSMTATTASDPGGVEYYFDCIAGGGYYSGWQDSPTYEDTGLQPETQYTYRVQARDKSENQNTTNWSGSRSATTLPSGGDTTPPDFNGLESATGTWYSITLEWSEASDPAAPITYTIYRAASPGEQDFNNPLASTQNCTYSDSSAQWWTTYYYVVRAKDSFGNEDTNAIEHSASRGWSW
jgi:hypothetical protein